MPHRDRWWKMRVAFVIATSLAGSCKAGLLEAVRVQNGALVPLGINAVSSIAFGINDAGIIVGEADSSVTRAFLWQNGNVTYLGDGSARSINNLGQVVGVGGLSGNAVLWSNGTTTDLGKLSGYIHTGASTINTFRELLV